MYVTYLKVQKEFPNAELVIAGKAHPMDNIGASHIQNIMDHIDKLNGEYKHLKVLILAVLLAMLFLLHKKYLKTLVFLAQISLLKQCMKYTINTVIL